MGDNPEVGCASADFDLGALPDDYRLTCPEKLSERITCHLKFWPKKQIKTADIQRIIQNPLKTFLIRFSDGLMADISAKDWNRVIDEIEADPAYAHISTYQTDCAPDETVMEPTGMEHTVWLHFARSK